MVCYLTKETTVCCGGKDFFLYFHFPEEKKIDKINSSAIYYNITWLEVFFRLSW